MTPFIYTFLSHPVPCRLECSSHEVKTRGKGCFTLFLTQRDLTRLPRICLKHLASTIDRFLCSRRLKEPARWFAPQNGVVHQGRVVIYAFLWQLLPALATEDQRKAQVSQDPQRGKANESGGLVDTSTGQPCALCPAS